MYKNTNENRFDLETNLQKFKKVFTRNTLVLLMVFLFTCSIAYGALMNNPKVPNAQLNYDKELDALDLIETDILNLQEYQRLTMDQALKVKEAKLVDICLSQKVLATAKATDFYNDKYILAENETIKSITELSEKECTMLILEEKVEEKVSPKEEYNIEGHLMPKSLFYIFSKKDSVSISQSSKEHFANNGYLATDISTHGKYLEVYAPSWDYIDTEGNYFDEPRVYTAKIVHNYGTMGLTLELHWEEDDKNYNWAIGHMHDIWVKDGEEVKTGQKFGSSGGCVGDLQEGEVSTGCHVHIELRLEGEAIVYPTYTSTPHGDDLKALKSYKSKIQDQKEVIATSLYQPIEDYLISHADPILHDKASVIYNSGMAHKIKPEVITCIIQSDTSGGKYLKSKNNVGNVGNLDRGTTQDFDSIDEAIDAIPSTLNNKYMKGNEKLGELSGTGLSYLKQWAIEENPCTDQTAPNKCYATSYGESGYWHKNMVSCLSEITGQEVDEYFLIRL